MISSYIQEKDFFEILSNESSSLFYPLKINTLKKDTNFKNQFFDAIIKVTYLNKEVRFLAEFINRTRPQFINTRLDSWFKLKNENILLVVPNLTEYIYNLVIEHSFSVIDLNGNYFIKTKDFLAIRTDRTNNYKEPSYIKNIYSNNSSLVGRLLLREDRVFHSVNEVYQEVLSLGGEISLATISKVLKVLEEELIIEKNNKYIKLIQPDKLLNKLTEGYTIVSPDKKLMLKISIEEFIEIAKKNNLKWCLSPESSVEIYTLTTPSSIKYININDIKPFSGFINSRFYNTVVNLTLGSLPYFDLKTNNNLIYSSEIQTYLALSKMDKREQDLAYNLEKKILGKFK